MQPQQPYSAPFPPPPPGPPAPASPRRRTGPLVAALAIGLLVGGGATGAAWALFGGGGSGPASDAQGACNALANFEEADYTAGGKKGDMALYRFAGAFDLSAAAAAGDSEYKPLADAISRTRLHYASEGEFNAEVKKDLDKARGICDDL
ncbi:hypothetical protein ABZ208_11065 [Streptomyces sp. NPDC006208]|uniref:hypothetical protein n=1 Tax=Streptomyces sp. NPDC006208 TaxID=3156734 RepID=UPI0033A387C7